MLHSDMSAAVAAVLNTTITVLAVSKITVSNSVRLFELTMQLFIEKILPRCCFAADK